MKKRNQVYLVALFFTKTIISDAFVESEGLEPSSKQAIKGLSTRLVFYCFFDCKLAKDSLLTT